MKKRLEKMLASKQEQRKNLNNALVECDNKEERASINEAIEGVDNEIAEIRGMLADCDAPIEGAPTGAPIVEGRKLDVVASMQTGVVEGAENAEARAKKFAETNAMNIATSEARSVLVAGGTLATPTEVAGINETVGAKVSSIVDLVKITDASGMGAYKVAYQLTDAEAETTAEGAEASESDATFNFAEITPETETVISYISKEARKQTPLNYEEKVRSSAFTALRKKAAKFITAKILASEIVTDLDNITLDETTLRKVAFNYGGDESIVGAATLFINKKDLVKLGDVRGSDKKAVYEITPDASNPNTGIIKDGGLSVAYCIDSNLTEGTLVYGQSQCFELALFSDYEISVSTDFKFDKRLLAVAGDVTLGGAVVVPNGFVVATVGAGA